MIIAMCVCTHNEPEERLNIMMARINDTVGEGHLISRVNDKDSIGKGFALREAIKAVNADIYILIDGDGDIDPLYIAPIVFYLNQGYDVVVGKKELPHRWDRRWITYLSRIWIKLLFGIGVDTQTGIKGFKYKPEWELNGWAFDIEVLMKAKRAKKKILEVPIHAVVSSDKSWHDLASTLRDTLKLRMGL